MEDYNLDCVIVVSNAPGNSKYNPVEHIMSYLNYCLSGLFDLLKDISEVEDNDKILEATNIIRDRINIQDCKGICMEK